MEDNLFKQIAIPISNDLNKFKKDESLWNNTLAPKDRQFSSYSMLCLPIAKNMSKLKNAD